MADRRCTRRQYLSTAGAMGVAGLAGCGFLEGSVGEGTNSSTSLVRNRQQT